MFRTGLRWRRLWLGVTVLLASLGVLAVPASAALSFDNTTDTSITLDGDAHWFNEARPLTHGNYQYVVYWDAEAPGLNDPAALKVTRRRLSDNNLQSFNFDGTWELTDVDDPHNQVRAGLSTIDGRLHIAWTTHNDELNYVYSSAGCLSQATFSSCTWTHTNTQADRAHESDFVTYPIFFSDHDGNLFMTYRWGSSERGDQYLNKYDNDGTWTAVGQIMHGEDNGPDPGTYDPDGAGPIDASVQRGPYIWGFRFDRDGRMHAMWNWREDDSDLGGSWAQHGAYYAYSDDDGATWFNSAGTRVATANSDALKVTDSGLEVVNVPYGTHFSGYEMELDSHNQPHAVLPTSDVVVDDLRDSNLRQLHVWRTSNGSWYSGWIDPAGGNWQTYSIGDLMFDRSDNAYYVYNENNLGWSGWNALPFSPGDLRQDHVSWQGGDHINIQQMSDITAIVTNNHADTAISTSGNKQVRVRMRNNTEGDDVLFSWTTDASPGWSLARTQTFSNSITTGDRTTWKTYTFTITDADWTGNLRDFEFDPILGTTAEADDEIDVDYIRITDAAGNIAKAWEFNEGTEVVAAEASPTGNWSSWTLDTLLPGVSDVWADGTYQMDDQRYADGTGDTKKVNFPMLEQGAPEVELLTLREFDVLGDTTLKFWNFDVDEQGWTAGTHVSSFRWESDGGANSVSGTITGNDSRIYSDDNLKVKVASEKTVQVRLKNTSSATEAAFCFITDADRTWNATKCKVFTITANSGYTEYAVDMTGIAGWASNTLYQVRLDPADNASSGSFKLHRLYIAP
jgi:hypothetical protein